MYSTSGSRERQLLSNHNSTSSLRYPKLCGYNRKRINIDICTHTTVFPPKGGNMALSHPLVLLQTL